jgi:mercuric ion binding protein
MHLRLLRYFIVGASLALNTSAAAAERTVTLAVDNMTCASCTYMVENSLEEVAGVIEANASLEDDRAVVRFDNSQTDVEALTQATENVGYPSQAVESAQ